MTDLVEFHLVITGMCPDERRLRSEIPEAAKLGLDRLAVAGVTVLTAVLRCEVPGDAGGRTAVAADILERHKHAPGLPAREG